MIPSACKLSDRYPGATDVWSPTLDEYVPKVRLEHCQNDLKYRKMHHDYASLFYLAMWSQYLVDGDVNIPRYAGRVPPAASFPANQVRCHSDAHIPVIKTTNF